jgi:hypothetical protein
MGKTLLLFLLLSSPAGHFSASPLIDVSKVSPGMQIESAITALAVAESGVWRRRQFVVDALAFPGLLEPQKVVLTADLFGRLRALHVQVFAARGEVDRVYERLRRELIELHGPPRWERRAGTGDRAVAQWKLGTGHLMAGVPRRVDGRDVVEVAITADPIGRAEHFWGADDFGLE